MLVRLLYVGFITSCLLATPIKSQEMEDIKMSGFAKASNPEVAGF